MFPPGLLDSGDLDGSRGSEPEWGARGVLREESSPAAPPLPSPTSHPHLPPQLIYMYWMNTVVNYCGPFEYEVGYCERLKNFLEANLEWMQKEMELNNGSAYWHQVGAAPVLRGWGRQAGSASGTCCGCPCPTGQPGCHPLLSASPFSLPPLPIHPPTHLPTRPFSHLSRLPSPHVHPFLSPPIHPSLHPPTHPSFHPPILSSVCPASHPPTHPSVCPSIYPSMHPVCQLICPPPTSLSIFHSFLIHPSVTYLPILAWLSGSSVHAPCCYVLFGYLSQFIIYLSVHLPSLLPV